MQSKQTTTSSPPSPFESLLLSSFRQLSIHDQLHPNKVSSTTLISSHIVVESKDGNWQIPSKLLVTYKNLVHHQQPPQKPPPHYCLGAAYLREITEQVSRSHLSSQIWTEASSELRIFGQRS
jgi:hypothetical protein